MDDYIIRTLTIADISAVHQLLYFSFQEYNKDSYETIISFKIRMRQAGVVLDLSFGAFKDDKLIGVMLNAIDYVYAFDFITAVHPNYRGMRIAIKLYERSTQALTDQRIFVYRSEIFQANNTAFLLYQGLGMRKIRELWTYKGNISHLRGKNTTAHKKCYKEFHRELATDIDHLPSWENSLRIIDRNKELYDLYYINNPFLPRIIGYAIVQKNKGIIRQFHVEQTIFRKYFAKQLITKIAQDYTVVKAIDIDRDWNWLINFYEYLDFNVTNEVNEMEVVLNSRAGLNV